MKQKHWVWLRDAPDWVQGEFAQEFEQLEEEVEFRLNEYAQLEAENEALREKIDALVERAERVQEGEDWDLAEFILRKANP